MGSPVSTDEYENRVLRFIVGTNDMQLIDINRSKQKCRLCNDSPFDATKLTNITSLDVDIQLEFEHIFRSYFRIPFDYKANYTICICCLQKCQDIINIKNVVE